MQLRTLPSKISYSTTQVFSRNGSSVTIPRRELFDVRAQLMAEDQTPDELAISGLSSDDVQPNVYEGGFKTWECSLDLSHYLLTLLEQRHESTDLTSHFIEVHIL